MKKLRGLFVTLLMMLVLVGCNAESNMNVSKEGKGTFSTKLSFDKDRFTAENYSKVNGAQGFAKVLENQTSRDIELKYEVDTTSSKDKDYVTVSFDYDSIEEFNTIIEKLYELREKAIDERDLQYIDNCLVDFPHYNDRKECDEVLKQYLLDNGIDYDVNSVVYKTLLNRVSGEYEEEINRCVEEENFIEDTMNEDVVNTKVNYNKTEIENNGNESIIRINEKALGILQYYIMEVASNIGDELFDMPKVNATVDSYTHKKVINICKKIVNDIELSGEIKGLIDANSSENVEEYSLELLNAEEINGLFDDKLDAKMESIHSIISYIDIDTVFVSNCTELEKKMNMDMLSVLLSDDYKSCDVTVKYCNNVKKLKLADLNDDEYLVMSSKDGKEATTEKVDANKENIAKGEYDNTPATGDATSLVLLFAVLAVAGVAATFTYRRTINR